MSEKKTQKFKIFEIDPWSNRSFPSTCLRMENEEKTCAAIRSYFCFELNNSLRKTLVWLKLWNYFRFSKVQQIVHTYRNQLIRLTRSI